jgi:cytochrome b
VASNFPERPQAADAARIRTTGAFTAPEKPGTSPALTKVRIWDLPLRLFHWLLVACLIGSFVTIKVGGDWIDWHFRFGYSALALILFRLLWGFAGPRYARFSSFVFAPSSLLASLRGAPHAPRTLGHSPVGALSVFALLAAIGIQATAGLFTSDDIASEGPLASLVSNATVERASWVHHTNELVILALVGLHITAIIYYRVVKRQSLVKPMLVGDKLLTAAAAGQDATLLAARDDSAIRIRALVLAMAAVAIVACILNWPLF